MLLAFRCRDYDEMVAVAKEKGLSLGETIIEAVRTVRRDPNCYSNPKVLDEYNLMRQVTIDMEHQDFQKVLIHADFQNVSLETYIFGAVMMLKWMENCS